MRSPRPSRLAAALAFALLTAAGLAACKRSEEPLRLEIDAHLAELEATRAATVQGLRGKAVEVTARVRSRRVNQFTGKPYILLGGERPGVLAAHFPKALADDVMALADGAVVTVRGTYGHDEIVPELVDCALVTAP